MRKIVFAIMDWMTDGALTDRVWLQQHNEQLFKDREYWCKKEAEHHAKAVNLERANLALVTENQQLRTALKLAGCHSEVDQFVSDKTKICDLNTRIQGLEARLRKLQGNQPKGPSWTGEQMGLKKS